MNLIVIMKTTRSLKREHECAKRPISFVIEIERQINLNE